MGDADVFITVLLKDWGRIYFLHVIQLKTHTYTASCYFPLQDSKGSFSSPLSICAVPDLLTSYTVYLFICFCFAAQKITFMHYGSASWHTSSGLG